MSHNVRVWTRDRDPHSVWYWKRRMSLIRAVIESESPDILCLQELSFPATLRIPKGYRRVCATASHPIYVREGYKTRNHRFHLRWDSCEVNLGGAEWMLVINVHLHWDEDIFARNMRKIGRLIAEACEKDMDVVACGDWNMPADTLARYLDDGGMFIYRNDDYTFKNKDTGVEGTIDHFAANIWTGQLATIKNPVPLSDHRPITLTIQ